MDPIRVALYDLLADDAALDALSTGIYHRRAGPQATRPFVTFNKQSGTPRYQMQGSIENEVWQVKGVSEGEDSEVAEAISQRLDALLHDAPLVIAGEATMLCRRLADVDYSEEAGERTFHHSGGLYRIMSSPDAGTP